jgi:3-dehydroquinate synthase
VPTVKVDVLNSPYQITIEPGIIASAAAMIENLLPAPPTRVCIVTDENVAPAHLGKLEMSFLIDAVEVVTAIIPSGEQHKNLATLSTIYDKFLSARIERTTPILALGGGVVGDMAGFAAASILRGVPFVQVPTTLLSMVDASVGGKTGVDHAVGKNLIGAFHQPVSVLIDPETLKTLPERELRSGLAECIKHEIIRDAEGFSALEKSLPLALSLNMPYLTQLIAHNVAIKAKVVMADPFEKGERAHLNFGHTFGHAIESVSKFSYSHGESIALGIVAASRAAMKLGMLDESSDHRIIKLIAAAGLPTGGMTLDVAQVYEAMYFDKKVKSGKLRLVLPDRIGHVVIRDDVPQEIVRGALESLRG